MHFAAYILFIYFRMRIMSEGSSSNQRRDAQGLENYNVGQVSAASNVQRLLAFYQALAPVCIGGPSSTSLDLVPQPSLPAITAVKASAQAYQQSPSSLYSLQSVTTIAKSIQSTQDAAIALFAKPPDLPVHHHVRNHHHNDSSYGFFPKFDINDEQATGGGIVRDSKCHLSPPFHPLLGGYISDATLTKHSSQSVNFEPSGFQPQPGLLKFSRRISAPPHSSSLSPAATSMFSLHNQRPLLSITGENGGQSVADQSQFYTQLYERMKVVQQSMTMAMAASITPSSNSAEAAGGKCIWSLQNKASVVSNMSPLASNLPLGGQGRSRSSALREKRRLKRNSLTTGSTITGNGARAGSGSRLAVTHLTGDMIRRLRERKKKGVEGGKIEQGSTSNNVTKNLYKATPSDLRSLQSQMHLSTKIPQVDSQCNTIIPSDAARVGPLSVPTTSGSDDCGIGIRRASSLLPPPIMSRRDCSVSQLEETILVNGTIVLGFNVGGEPRLCLPQILKRILNRFRWEQIRQACEDLQIHCSLGTSPQLVALKVASAVPIATHQCGLVTKTDAQRLIAYLFAKRRDEEIGRKRSRSNSSEAQSDNDQVVDDVDTRGKSKKVEDDNNKDVSPSQDYRSKSVQEDPPIHIVHRCFGKAYGVLFPHMYTGPHKKCIRCKKCGDLMSPRDFVLHLHDYSENRTCHWGFDSDRWRSYIHVHAKRYLHYRQCNGDEDANDGDLNTSEQKREDVDRISPDIQGKLASTLINFDAKETNVANIFEGAKSSLNTLKAKFDNNGSNSSRIWCWTKEKTIDTSDEEKKKKKKKNPSTNKSPHVTPSLSRGQTFRPWSNTNNIKAKHDSINNNNNNNSIDEGDNETTNIKSLYCHQNEKKDGDTHDDDPTCYVEKARQSLTEDQGLSPRNREFVLGILDRLADRVTCAENSKNVVMHELICLKERFQKSQNPFQNLEEERLLQNGVVDNNKTTTVMGGKRAGCSSSPTSPSSPKKSKNSTNELKNFRKQPKCWWQIESTSNSTMESSVIKINDTHPAPSQIPPGPLNDKILMRETCPIMAKEHLVDDDLEKDC